MLKVSKKRKLIISKLEPSKKYSLLEASSLVKEITTVKFDASVDLSVRLGVDPKKSNEMVRGIVSLPNGTGKNLKVLALVTPDYIGLDEYITKIKGGWTDIDVIVTLPSVMAKLGPLGKVLGPRGLMPNPKTGTVTMDIKKAILDVKGGKIDFKVEKAGIVHASIGKVSFDSKKIFENADELIKAIIKLKPSSTKGTYIKSIFMSSTMSPSISIDYKF